MVVCLIKKSAQDFRLGEIGEHVRSLKFIRKRVKACGMSFAKKARQRFVVNECELQHFTRVLSTASDADAACVPASRGYARMHVHIFWPILLANQIINARATPRCLKVARMPSIRIVSEDVCSKGIFPPH